MLYRKINVELIVIADDVEAVVGVERSPQVRRALQL
jgi:hypothetical protein